jgi:hypothetical protein
MGKFSVGDKLALFTELSNSEKLNFGPIIHNTNKEAHQALGPEQNWVWGALVVRKSSS